MCRTGTYSLKQALSTLLNGKVAHMVDLVTEDRLHWNHIYSGNATDNEFQNHFLNNGYVGGVDIPFCLHYEQALRVFPNALVILMTRDLTKWEKSVENTVVKAIRINQSFPVNLFTNIKCLSVFLGQPAWDPIKSGSGNLFIKALISGQGKEYYKRYQEEVKNTVPADRLLEYNIKEGWEPLCKFLGVEIPDKPFPRLNDTAEFQRRIDQKKNQAWMLLYEVVSLGFIFGYFVYNNIDTSIIERYLHY